MLVTLGPELARVFPAKVKVTRGRFEVVQTPEGRRFTSVTSDAAGCVDSVQLVDGATFDFQIASYIQERLVGILSSCHLPTALAKANYFAQ
jgi:hypothetical protein